MKKISLVSCVSLASLTVLALLPCAAFAGPSDIVPQGSITYDLLGSLAAKGVLSDLTLRDFFRGDRLYTRSECAAFIRRIQRSNLAPPDRFALKILETEFAAELHAGSLTQENGPLQGRITGLVKARALTDPEAGSVIARVSGVVPIGRDSYAALMVGDYRDEWYDKSAPRKGGYPPIETAYLRSNGRALDVTIGQMPLRWGPGYVGGMLLSDNAVSLPQIRVEKTFRLPGGLGRKAGLLRFEQFDAQFFEADISSAASFARGTRRYLLGRRIETAGDGRFSVSLGESFKSTRLPSPILANILPFYLYQNEWTRSGRHHLLGGLVSGALEDTGWLNYLADVNLAYRADRRGTTLYSDLLLDDFKAPAGLGLPGPAPKRKLGGQVGVYAPDLGALGGKYGLRLEFATIDTGTYTNISPPVAYNENGVALGHPAGPNAQVYFGRFDVAASPKVKLAIEGTIRRQKDESTLAPKSDRVGLYASYALRRDAFLGARFEHVRTQNDATANSNGNRVELNAGIGF